MSKSFGLRSFLQGSGRTIKKIQQIGFLFLLKKIVNAYKQRGLLGGISYTKKNVKELFRRTLRYGSYDRWLQVNDFLTPSDVHLMKERIQSWDAKPLISIIMPTFNGDPIFLSAAIDSVVNQIYENWELCIADDCSSDAKVAKILKQYAAQDNRIKFVMREKNGHISAASNTALSIATGDWIALLDHDDLLATTALYWVADAINSNPSIQIMYSDEDKIDSSGKRFEPFFKPNWNQDLFYSQNYFCHLGVYRKKLIDEIGDFRVGFEGAQDYDLVLRCIEKIPSTAIHHIAKVLYHWRSHELSTALSVGAKNYAVEAGERALNEHFQRIKIGCQVEAVEGGYRAHYDLPHDLPLVSLIIIARNNPSYVRSCIESIFANTLYSNYEIILVDISSTESPSYKDYSSLAKNDLVKLIHYPCDPNELNYSAINNFAASQASGELIALIDDGIEVISSEWLSEMVSIAIQDGVGAVGAKILNEDGSLLQGGLVLGVCGIVGSAMKGIDRDDRGYFSRAQLISSYSAISSDCLLVKKTDYLCVGGLNERELKTSFSDVDFCLRLKEAGLRNVWTPYALLSKRMHQSEALQLDPTKIKRIQHETEYMQDTWASIMKNDPAYNPNLTLDSEDFAYSGVSRA